jgi:hypothetical protein
MSSVMLACFLACSALIVIVAQASAVGSWSVGQGDKDVAAPLVPSIFTGSDIRARFDSYPVGDSPCDDDDANPLRWV